GNARIERGKLEKDDAAVVAGIADLRRTADLYEAMQRPTDRAAFLADIGQALVSLGNMRSSAVEARQAIEAYGQAMQLYRDVGQPAAADGLRKDLAHAQVELGYQLSKAGDLAGAVDAYRASLDNRDRGQDPA